MADSADKTPAAEPGVKRIKLATVADRASDSEVAELDGEKLIAAYLRLDNLSRARSLRSTSCRPLACW